MNWGEVRRVIDSADVVLHVLDIRDPLSTFSRRVESIVERSGKTLVLVLNKSDLVPREIAEAWKEYFAGKGYRAVYVSVRRHQGTLILRREIKRSAPILPATVAVVGFPKTGKSSVINALKGRHSAPTSPYPGSPGYTRGVQYVRVDRDILMIDTPGVIPVEGDLFERIIRGTPIELIDDPVGVASMVIKRVLENNPDSLKIAYGIDSSNPEEILEQIAIKHGWFYKKTREPLIEEAARKVIRDFHDGIIPYYVDPRKIKRVESSGQG
ncbi:GTPase [Thermogladius sp. 4427co]|uniref:GTPase n=1 Tax=Thermogladius sp. 4427co TaxID=3450718 RepID=UPI003F7A81E8